MRSSTRPPPARILITGASSGIGAAFAREAPTTSALLLTGRDDAALGRLATELRDLGRRVDTVAADLTEDAGLDAVAAAADAAGIDLFVCNAGRGPWGDFLDAPEAELRATVLLNTLAPTLLIRRLLPGMLNRASAGGGRAGLIVTSSNTAFTPVPRLAAYAATKAFDLSLTESLTAELAGEPIDILALCPTATRSNFAARAGFGRGFPVAQPAGHVARVAYRALGRQTTLVLGPVSAALFAGPAVARASAARALHTVLRRL